MCAIARDCLRSTWKDGHRGAGADSLRNVGFKFKASRGRGILILIICKGKMTIWMAKKKKKRKRIVESLTMEISGSETKIEVFFVRHFLTQEHCSLKYLRTARISQRYFRSLSLSLFGLVVRAKSRLHILCVRVAFYAAIVIPRELWTFLWLCGTLLARNLPYLSTNAIAKM